MKSINWKVIKPIIIGTLLGMLISFGATVVSAIIGLFVGIEDDPSKYEFKIGFIAGSAYWLTFFIYLFHKGIFQTNSDKDGTDKGTN